MQNVGHINDDNNHYLTLSVVEVIVVVGGSVELGFVLGPVERDIDLVIAITTSLGI